jgi:hypothetical protein
MKKRGLASPDNGDALALTFAYPVVPSDHRAHLRSGSLHQFEYDPFREAFENFDLPGTQSTYYG